MNEKNDINKDVKNVVIVMWAGNLDWKVREFLKRKK
jgi:hypothetical protein